MGISVSASTAVVFLGMFVAAGILYPAVHNGGERLLDAREDSFDRSLAQTNTEIDLFKAVYYQTNGTLAVNVTNTGTTTLNLPEVNLLVDSVPNSTRGTYQTSIGGDSNTEVWLPGETANISVEPPVEPSRVKVVVDYGVSEAISVEVR